MVTKEMTILEIAEKYPESLKVFKIYDQLFQTCICCHSLFDSLEKVCNKYGLDLEKMLLEINTSIYE